MSTIQNILDQAAYELGYIEYGAALDATDTADALIVFNQMMAEWNQGDKKLDIPPQDTASDVIYLPLWAEAGVVSLLGMRLATRFNVAPPATLVKSADDGEKFILRTLINLKIEERDMTHLPLGAHRSRDILNDA